MEFVWQERLIYPGLKLARVFVPYFDLEYEKFYFNQPGLGGARLTKSQGFWGGIGLHLPLSFWENTFRFYFSYLQAVSVNADGNGESKDFSGYQFHYWVRYNRVGPLFWELHGLNHSAKTTSYNLSTQKSYVLLGIEF